MTVAVRTWTGYDPHEVCLDVGDGRDQHRRSILLAEMLADRFCLEPPLPVGLPGFASGRVTLLPAREKAGKSTLMAWVAARVTQAKNKPDGGPGTVLIVQLEGHPDEWAQALVRFGADANRAYLLHRPRAAQGKPA